MTGGNYNNVSNVRGPRYGLESITLQYPMELFLSEDKFKINPKLY
jgi:hypothetical protein